MKNRKVILIAVLGIMLYTGCAPSAIQDAQPQTDSTPSPNEIVTPDRINPTMTKLPERVPPTEIIPPVTGEVPKNIMDSLMNDLSSRIGAAPNQIAVNRAQEVVWNDGSLGCPKPGEAYTQALVKGYWVVLEVNGKQYDYRAAETGYFLLCERGIPPAPPVTPSS